MRLAARIAKLAVPGALAFAFSASASWAIPTTFEATIFDVTGSAALLDELGIASGGTLTARFTFDTDRSTGATVSTAPAGAYTFKRDAYDSFSLLSPNGTIDAIAADGTYNRVTTRDGDPASGYQYRDYFEIASMPESAAEDLYYIFYLFSEAYNAEAWDSAQPLDAALLNSLTHDSFSFEKYVNGAFSLVQSSTISYRQISAVPLPSGLALLLPGFALLFGLGRRGRSRRLTASFRPDMRRFPREFAF